MSDQTIAKSSNNDEHKPSNPEGWPAEAELHYKRIRPIGNGAYGKVWLARRRKPVQCAHRSRTAAADAAEGDGDDDCNTLANNENNDYGRLNTCERCNSLVAMKVISTSGKNGRSYADREVSILKEMDHPNVLRLVQSYDECKGGRLVALSLARGPTLRSILDGGGAIGLPLARLISRHLVAAVSYLHSRAVLHRDVKPDNCILDHGINWEQNDVIWDDDECEAEKVIQRQGWKVVLIDLGFARALSPEELSANRKNDTIAADPVNEVQGNNNDDENEFGQSMTARILLRSMSALGSRAYAAPEMVRARKGGEEDSSLANYVADYTLLADEYALGRTLLEALTGVPASERDINEYVRHERLTAYLSGGQKMRYRLTSEIPKDASELLRDLTRPRAQERITCWVAQLYPWICGGKDEELYKVPQGNVSSRPGDGIVVLECMDSRGEPKLTRDVDANNACTDIQEEVPTLQVV